MSKNKPAPTLIFIANIFFLLLPSHGYPAEEPGNFDFRISSYLRQDLVTFKNLVDLDSANRDDSTTYLGIDYNIGFDLKVKEPELEFYAKLERNGPYDYSAPLFVHNTLMNTGGVIEEYQNDELLPALEEFWLDASFFDLFRAKAGLYTYEVGNGFALNGGYENYGFTFYKEADNFSWHIYYCRPDLVYKNHLGPRIRQEEEQGIDYNHGAANFFAADADFKTGSDSYQPYVGVLSDYTSPEKRDNVFAAPIKRDILGTVGIAWNKSQGNLSCDIELARNFGKGTSEDPEFKDIYHTGYLVYAGAGYDFGKLTPSFNFLLCSGNKTSADDARDGAATLSSGKNRAFSYFSPLNNNLLDSISSSNVDMLPIVAMGGGYGLQYGIPRPATFGAADFDNLIMPRASLGFEATEKLTFSLDGYYLRSFERGVGTFEGEGKRLSADLGKEIDLIIDYQLNEHTLISILGGYFIPGKFYKEDRDDTAGSLFSPFVRGDGVADPAYEIDLALEFTF